MATLAILAKAYRNSAAAGAGYATPTWNEISGIREVTVSDTKETYETTTRTGNGIKSFVPTLTEYSFSFKMPCPEAGAAAGNLQYDDYIVFRNAYYSGGVIDMLILDGTTTEVGAEGIRFFAAVEQFEQDQSDNARLTTSIKLVITDPDVATLASAATPGAKPAKRARIGSGPALTMADFGSSTFA